jgi:3-dehydroquinate synthase
MNTLEEARQVIDEADKAIAEQFERRMNAVKQIAKYKKENNIPITDSSREKEIMKKNSLRIENAEFHPYYVTVISDIMAQSKKYQRNFIGQEPQKITVSLDKASYDVTVKRGALKEAGELFNLDRKVLVVTDDGVPSEYAKTVAAECKEAYIYTVEQGEKSKSLPVFQKLLSFMLQKNFSRKDAVVAVGGGVVGDLAGFTASAYMRGIDFYNIPTTILSQVDSSIGGKTAVNLDNIKNIVGAFYQPKGVIIDSNVLSTLPKRQISNGLAEAIKAAVIADEELFEIFENEDIEENLEKIIYRSLDFKRKVVEEDEKESGLRRILNFGHTIGHGIESEEELNGLYHGECVALGMIPMCSEDVRQRLIPVLKKAGLPTEFEFNEESLAAAISHDKKSSGKNINAVITNKIGTCKIIEMTAEEITARAEAILPKK